MGPQKTYLRETASFDVICVIIDKGVLTVGKRKNVTKSSRVNSARRGAKNHACREMKPLIRSV